MSDQKMADRPVEGKTYSLFGDATSTTQYYSLIKNLADVCLKRYPDTHWLLAHVQKASEKKQFLRDMSRKHSSYSPIPFIARNLRNALSLYTGGVKAHLRDSSAFKLLDSILATTEEQYHLYMLEIELANRAFIESFKACETKLAFLPHCLHDLDKNCRAKPEPGDIDYVCKGCSPECFINRVSALLRAHGIKPYIWRDAELEEVFNDFKARGVSIGVLGIACIPELVHGMRLCRRFDIPAVGIPLNANRCARWMGKFHDTSVNLEEVEKLIS
ncbi:MAG TPA: DUF116 domain-containing protein [Anaerolineae bacterium]|nr:DUF116 domain-containing protein [Anaerolineae bacterium]